MRDLEPEESFNLLPLIRKSPKDGLEYIRVNKLNPSQEKEIISEYFIQNVKDEIILLKCLNEIRDMGGNPEFSTSNIKAIVKRNYKTILFDFIKRGCLDIKENKDEITYFLNIAIMDNSIECFNLLKSNADIKNFDLFGEIPFPLHVAISYQKKWAIDLFINEGLFLDYFDNKDFAYELGKVMSKVDEKSFEEKTDFIKNTLNGFSIKKLKVDGIKEINKINFNSDTLGDDILSVIKLLEYKTFKKKILKNVSKDDSVNKVKI